MQDANHDGARPLVSRLFLAVVGYLAIIFTSAAIAPRLPPDLPQEDTTRALSVLIFATMLAICLALSRQARAFQRRQWALGRTQGPRIVLAALAGVAFHAVYVIASDMDLARIQGWQFNLHFLLASVLLSSLLIPLVEEVLFRGVAIGSATGRWALASTLLSSVFFAAIHPDRWLSVFLFSLMASAIYLRVGLLGSYAFHAAYNLANFAFLLIVSSQR